jgi:uncharacterized protein (TIGR03083 family)
MTEGLQRAEAAEPSWAPVPVHVSYRAVREGVSRLLTERPEAGLVPVPACPGWTVRDVLAHLVDICRSVHSHRAGESAVSPFDSAGAGLSELLAEWAGPGEQVEPLIAASGGARVLVMDAFTHELDIRRALGAPPPADHPAYPDSLDLVAEGFSRAVHAHGLPALRLETPGAQWTAGPGEPVATVRAHRHDLYRSLSGRRTLAQIDELSWSGSGSAAAWGPAFTWGPFHPPEVPTESAIAAR